MLMLAAYIKKYPTLNNECKEYCLGPGHMKFFKDKTKYLEKRHELLKKEMTRRGFETNKTLKLKSVPKNLNNDWTPKPKDRIIIKKRILEKIKSKPNFYRYRGEYKPFAFFKRLLN
jgi:deoxyribonuclease (pyrimidine dimer)